MKLVLFNYNCPCCGENFKVAQLPPHAYGEFLLRRRGRDAIRYLDAINDRPYAEVSDEIDKILLAKKGRSFENSDVLQKVFGAIACDPDFDGEQFEIGLPPPCPVCGNQGGFSWRMTEPIETADVEVAPITHTLWNKLSHQEKIIRIGEKLAEI
ncbi:hypothetical protein H3H36_18725 [Duganella sp. FT3S]|uniref:Uncharacterized protein n=1 Tax=Rugamonas fusca TaxID=2758568 RepID=A0A7W2EK39_9BURK|nr:hypothetical protein [Rugamonas fusca]MBA5607395.1 hypothetical protein [Rugamonas fusca]